jgi:hypothetical protein
MTLTRIATYSATAALMVYRPYYGPYYGPYWGRRCYW